MSRKCCAVAAAFALSVSAGSLTDVKHVVLFMQENRAFDHYFGTMPGVRGFADPNVQVNSDGRNTFQQPVIPSESNGTTHLTPWYINYLGGDWPGATQCMGAGSNSWEAMHDAYNGGLTNQWVASNTPYSWGFFKRDDIPVHFDIAEGWTVADMYQESVLAATDPNRIVWMSGTVNNPGTPSNPEGEGGMILDDTTTPGCEKPKLNCYPFTWKTFPEYLQDAGVSWQVYQDPDNFEDNPLAYFQQYQNASNSSALTTKGNSYIGLDKFYADAEAGTLPQVSYIIGPAELAEHYPYLPSDGAWLQKQVVDAVVNGAAYNETVLMISYDEVGGYGDHVTPFHAPKGTPGEWVNDPYGDEGDTPVGPGFRVPFYIISPWTRGGHVFTEHADHGSQIMFVENWLQAIGKSNVQSKELPPWRRAHMSNLLKAFDFDHPDYSIPFISSATPPLTDPSAPPVKDGQLGANSGNYIGAAKCQAMYPTSQPPVPYGPENANADTSKLVEDGFKPIRGSLTEGRYLTLELGDYALTNPGKPATDFTATKATSLHSDIKQRWIIHSLTEGGSTFNISSAADGRYVGSHTSLSNSVSGAETYTIKYIASKGYTLQKENGKYLTIDNSGSVQTTATPTNFEFYSVTYSS